MFKKNFDVKFKTMHIYGCSKIMAPESGIYKMSCQCEIYKSCIKLRTFLKTSTPSLEIVLNKNSIIYYDDRMVLEHSCIKKIWVGIWFDEKLIFIQHNEMVAGVFWTYGLIFRNCKTY